MRRGSRPSNDAGAWFVEAQRVHIASLIPQRAAADADKSGRVVIVTFTFLVLLAAGLLIGGHAAIDPLLQSAIDARESNSAGDVVFTLPDRVFCRRLSFDNVTAEVTEGGIERCQGDIAAGVRGKTVGSFRWR